MTPLQEAEALLRKYGPLIDRLAKPASRLIREQAHPGQIMHALVFLASRLAEKGWVSEWDHALSLDALYDTGWLHQWSEHLDPHTGPMPRRAQLALARRVAEIERRLNG